MTLTATMTLSDRRMASTCCHSCTEVHSHTQCHLRTTFLIQFQLQDMPTRWGLTLAMITRLLQNRDAITAYLKGQSHSLSLPREAE